MGDAGWGGEGVACGGCGCLAPGDGVAGWTWGAAGVVTGGVATGGFGGLTAAGPGGEAGVAAGGATWAPPGGVAGGTPGVAPGWAGAIGVAGLTWDFCPGSSTGAWPFPAGIARIESRLNLSNKSGFVGTRGKG